MNETSDTLDMDSLTSTYDGPVKRLKNEGGILTLGILSIILCGLIGVILGIISISMASNAITEYEKNPDMYAEASIKNVRAGKVCSIIGLSLFGFLLLVIIMVVAAR